MIEIKTNVKTIIGMIHVGALPGTPQNCLPIKKIIAQAIEEIEIYLSCGIDSVMIENMHDVPYIKCNVGAEIVASLTALAVELRKITRIPLGIQILAGANSEALAVAQAANFDFIRAEGFVFGHLADEGYIDSCAAELLRYRKMLGAESIAIFTDIKKKHSSHAVTADVGLEETIKAAEFFLSDGIIITGKATGDAALIEDVLIARQTTTLPVIIGSGITTENISEYWDFADAFIIGSHFKKNGSWKNSVEKEKVAKFLKKVLILRT